MYVIKNNAGWFYCFGPQGNDWMPDFRDPNSDEADRETDVLTCLYAKEEEARKEIEMMGMDNYTSIEKAP